MAALFIVVFAETICGKQGQQSRVILQFRVWDGAAVGGFFAICPGEQERRILVWEFDSPIFPNRAPSPRSRPGVRSYAWEVEGS